MLEFIEVKFIKNVKQVKDKKLCKVVKEPEILNFELIIKSNQFHKRAWTGDFKPSCKSLKFLVFKNTKNTKSTFTGTNYANIRWFTSLYLTLLLWWIIRNTISLIKLIKKSRLSELYFCNKLFFLLLCKLSSALIHCYFFLTVFNP